MTEQNLLPCPFGCTEGRVFPTRDENDDHVVYCSNCDAMGPAKTEQSNAITAWNARPTGDVQILIEGIERAKDIAFGDEIYDILFETLATYEASKGKEAEDKAQLLKEHLADYKTALNCSGNNTLAYQNETFALRQRVKELEESEAILSVAIKTAIPYLKKYEEVSQNKETVSIHTTSTARAVLSNALKEVENAQSALEGKGGAGWKME